ncbi:esterase-like activity of phytase family protein [Streptomyces antimicrobicus]|uniref:Esterase-like activity of phytase family protein n=1 Tax=Streptomyces antimicrobicus TaxID=2883108 RepID=A0ABS8BBB8_9ACTN|nr:esterase-like activity of phytase family protein [Streptomyces antimicrobicus]MCB5181924.1 esterase-like activity of phytase family protein [Streptomyces antimicrobicus]
MTSSLTRRACAVALLLTSTLAPAVAAAAPPGGPGQRPGHAVQARLIGERTVAHKLAFQGTTVGGLSGIDRNPCTGEYVFISDDRSYLQPARFYTAKLDVDAGGVHSVDFTGTHPFLQPDGSPYPSPALGDGKAVDPEEIRVDPHSCDYWWAQEGDRPKVAGPPVVQPSIQFASPVGDHFGQLKLPANYTVTMEERGPRRNQAIEAITFGAKGKVVTSAIEGPLLQDGPEPDVNNGALVRVTQQSRDGRVLGQFAYPLEKIFAENDPDSPWGPDTGVPSLLAFPDQPDRYLVLERTWVAGAGYKIRLFDATTRGATDVRAKESLAGQTVVPMRKRLVADFHSLGLSAVDNTEGMTWGPDLPTGERLLILVSDDNFDQGAITQIVALGIR